MKKAILILIIGLLLPFFALGQFYQDAWKTKLNYGTTSKGVIHYGNTAPSYTPDGGEFDCWMYQDTLTDVLYYWSFPSSSWDSIALFDNILNLIDTSYVIQDSIIKFERVDGTTFQDTIKDISGTGVNQILTRVNDTLFLSQSLDTVPLPPILTDITDGLALDKPDLTIVDATGLKLDVEALGGGDMQFQIDGIVGTLDCTTGSGAGGKARVSLTAGTDANNPATNYIYATRTGTTITLNSSGTLPTGAFAWVAKIVVPDATTWATTGAYLFQRYTESKNDSRGQISHEREKVRALGAVWINGVVPTTNIITAIGSPDTVHVATTSGSVYQLHRQSFPAFDTGHYYYGNGLDIYEEIANLSSALSEQDGTSLSGRYFNLVIWGAANYSTGECKLFVNLPNDSYISAAQASQDVNSSSDYSVPADFRSVAFLIARVVLRHQVASGGTWTEVETFDLRGTPLGIRTGGATVVASNEFEDSAFRVFDNGDPSKYLAFEVSGVTTGTTRTLTVPDKNGTIALLDDLVPDTVTYLRANKDSVLIYYANGIEVGRDTIYLPGGGGSGEVNTASSAGTGTSLYYQKVVADLQFNAIKSENNLLTVSLDGVTHDIELNVNEANIDHDNLTNFTTDEHFTQAAISITESQISDLAHTAQDTVTMLIQDTILRYTLNDVPVAFDTIRAAGDNLGNHIAEQNIQLGAYYISSDGDNEGILVGTSGQTTIESSTSLGGLRVDNTLAIAAGSWNVANFKSISSTTSASSFGGRIVLENEDDDATSRTMAYIEWERGSTEAAGELSFWTHDGATGLNENLTILSTKQIAFREYEQGAGWIHDITPAGDGRYMVMAAGGYIHTTPWVDHDTSHVFGAVDEIDGDLLGISWNPSNYAPTTSPTEVTNVDELTAHLAGIDAALLTAGGGGNGIFDITNDASSTPASMTVNITDSLNFENGLFFIDQVAQEVSIGNKAADSKLHVTVSDAGAVGAYSTTTMASFERSGGGYLQLQMASTGEYGIVWSNTAEPDISRFYYEPSTAEFRLNVGGGDFYEFEQTRLIADNYIFDIDQAVGVGTDDYILTYDNASGLISLEANAGGANGIFDATNDAGYTPTSMTVNITDSLNFDQGLLFLQTATNRRVGINTQSPEAELHVFAATAGTVAAFADAQIVIENSGHSYIQFEYGATSNGGLIFGNSGDNDEGLLVYDANDNEFQFTVGGGAGIEMTLSETTLTAVNYVFDIDQSLGAGQDDYVLTYDNASGTASFELATGGSADGNGIFDSGNEAAYTPTSMTVNVTDSLNFENKTMVITTTGVGFGNTTTEAPVHVYGSSAGSVAIDANTLITLEKGSSGYISFQGSGGAQGFLWADAADTDEARFYYNWGDNSMYLYANGAQEAVFAPTATTLGTYVFNTDQAVGAGVDNYVLTYDNGTGEIGLEAATGGGGNNGIFGVANDGGTVPTSMTVNLTDSLNFENGLLWISATDTEIGINTKTPETLVHAYAGTAGTVAAYTGSTMVIEDDTDNFLHFQTPSGSDAGIVFGTTVWNGDGRIIYDHSWGDLDIYLENTLRYELTSTEFVARNYEFDIDQTLTDRMVMVYASGDGQWSGEKLYPKTTSTTITGATKTLDLDSWHYHTFRVSNSGNNDCTLTINNEINDGHYIFHFDSMTASTDITFPAEFNDLDGTDLGTLTFVSSGMVSCYVTGSVGYCTYYITP